MLSSTEIFLLWYEYDDVLLALAIYVEEVEEYLMELEIGKLLYLPYQREQQERTVKPLLLTYRTASCCTALVEGQYNTQYKILPTTPHFYRRLAT